MAKKVFNMQGGRHSAAALSAFINAMYGSSVANGLDVLVTGSTGLSVNVQAGNGNIDTGQGFGRLIQIDAVQNVSLTAASPSNPRNDIIVAYIDNGVTPTTSVIDNTNDVLKFAAIAGTPASSPADPSNSTIQSAIGAGNPFMVLARIRVNAAVTSLTQGNITDLRKLVSPPLSTSMIGDLQVTTAKLANSSVTAGKLDSASFIWSSWVPTWSGLSVGNGVVSAKYTVVGKLVSARINIDFGTTTAVLGDIGFTNPVPAAINAGTGNITPRGTALAFSGSEIFPATVGNTSPTVSNLRFHKGGSPYVTLLTSPGSGVPFTWSSSSEIGISFSYEAA